MKTSDDKGVIERIVSDKITNRIKTWNPCPSLILSIKVFNPFQSFNIANLSQIPLSGTHVFVAQQFLHRADIIAILQEMGGEAVTKCMTTDVFVYSGNLRSFLDRFIQATLMNMVTPLYTASWIN